jgi:hypothetical protein
MNLTVRLAPPLRHWHRELVRRLSDDGHHVTVIETSSEVAPRTAHLERTLALESRLHGVTPRLSRPDSDLATGAGAGPGADLTIDLTPLPQSTPGTWHLEYDGRSGEGAAVEALLRNRVPVIDLVVGDGEVLTSIRPGSETPGVLLNAWEDQLARCLTLLVDATRGTQPCASPYVDDDDRAARAADQPDGSFRRHAMHQLTGTALRQVYRALYRAPHWRVGWRFVDGPGLIDRPLDPPSTWNVLPDDGLRFYADPFPYRHGDESMIFVEDFEHRLGRGVISVVRFDDAGPVGSPVPVLTHDVHLSYPFVLEDDGEIWMIPETSGAGTVELYRATRFPHRWQRERTLITGAEVSDATIFRHGDRWWMIGTVRDQGSFSDALHCWYADELAGPWSPHARNPVLVDIASARPAGRVVRSDGVLLRPAQDCRTGYGAALTVAEITHLDPETFDQRVTASLGPGSWWAGRRLHTLNRAGRLECIDGSAMSPRLRLPRRRDDDSQGAPQ